MSKVCLIADPHFGSKKNSDVFLSNHFNYFKNEVAPYLREHNITTIFILGDIYDNRNSINVKVKNTVYDLFADVLKDFKIFMIVGNHDTYFKNSITTHSLQFFKKFNNITVVDDIERIQIDKRYILMVPWQTDYTDFADRVARKNFHCDVCLGHFDISGFKLNKNKLCDEGLNAELFYNNYTLTFSGHFHTRSKSGKNNFQIIYIGSPYHLTRHDIGEERGFCVLDLEDLKYRFVNSKSTIKFVKINYPEIVNEKIIKNNIVDVIVEINDTYDKNVFQKYIKNIESFEPLFTPNVIIKNSFLDSSSLNDSWKNSGSILTMTKDYVYNLNITNKENVYFNLERLYNEVKNISSNA